MTEIVIGNEFKRRLNDISSEFFSMSPNKEKYWSFNDSDTSMTDGEYYCSDEALEKKLSKGKDHEGFPEEYLAQPISKMVEEDPEIWMHFRNKVKFDFAKEIGAHSSALLSYYPPGGHVGYAGGERLTLAYKFSNKSLMDDQNEKAIMMRDLAIEEIME